MLTTLLVVALWVPPQLFLDVGVTPPPTPAPTVPAPTVCPGDANGDGIVTIDELVRAVAAALEGCP